MTTTPADATTDAAPGALAEIADDRIDEIETAVFARIAEERSAARTRRTRRGRIWAGVGAAAAIVVVAAVLAPTIARVVSPPAADQPAAVPLMGVAESGGAASVPDGAARDVASAASGGGGSAGAGSIAGADATAGREIIATGSATVVVDDVPAAVRAVGDAAEAAGGYTESSTLGQSGAQAAVPGGPTVDVLPYPVPAADGGWISVRVPADRLTAVMDGLSTTGEVTASSVTRQDVTDQAGDLRARIDAAQASVTRLTELMAQATSTGDLIAAESALAERQATLESYQQQLASLDGQVAMSTLSVSLQPRSIAVTADPAGFGDGLTAGWNGLVATLNGIVVAIGFLLPWIAVAAVLAVIVWVIVRATRRSRRARRAAEAD
jgi:hypothetical protein